MDRMMDRIKYYRQRSGQTQAQVANKLGVAVSNYQKYELGEREPSEKTLPALADALGCSAYSLRESDKERFIRMYNKCVREVAMHRWDSYTFNADDFPSYDISEDIMAYFAEYFNQIEEVNPELYRTWQLVTDYPDALFRAAELLEQAQKADQRTALEIDFGSLITREHPVHFWYFIIFGYIFLDLFVGETSSAKIAADFQRYMCEAFEGCEEIGDGEAFAEYIHRICIPFFDYVLTAVEYMVDEHATLETSFQETVVGALCEIEIVDFSAELKCFYPAKSNGVAASDGAQVEPQTDL